MNVFLRLFALMLCIAPSFAWAGSSLPRGVFKLSEIEQAKVQAAEKSTPLIFVYTDLNSTCPLCNSATEDIFKSFRSRGTMVFLNSKNDDLKNAPRTVLDLRMKPTMGNIIPMVMVTNSDATKEIKGYSYEVLKGGNAGKAARDLRKTLESIDVTGATSAAKTNETTPASEPDLLAAEQSWQNAEGKTITAAVKRVSETSVTFVLPGGKEVDYPLAKLSEESRGKLAELAD